MSVVSLSSHLYRQLSGGPYLDARMFGMVGDGAFNNFGALQKAQVSAVTQKRPLWVPPGWYKTIIPIGSKASGINPQGDFTLIGSPMRTTLEIVGTDQSYGWPGFNLKADTFCAFKDLIIKGPDIPNDVRGSVDTYAIQINNGVARAETLLENVTFYGNFLNPLNATSGVGNNGDSLIQVKDCDWIHTWEQCAFIGCNKTGSFKQFVVEDSRFRNAGVPVGTLGYPAGHTWYVHEDVSIWVDGARCDASGDGSRYVLNNNTAGTAVDNTPKYWLIENSIFGQGVRRTALTGQGVAVNNHARWERCGFLGCQGPLFRAYGTLKNCELRPSVIVGVTPNGATTTGGCKSFHMRHCRLSNGWAQVNAGSPVTAGGPQMLIEGNDFDLTQVGQTAAIFYSTTSEAVWRFLNNRIRNADGLSFQNIIEVFNDTWTIADNYFGPALKCGKRNSLDSPINIQSGATKPVRLLGNIFDVVMGQSVGGDHVSYCNSTSPNILTGRSNRVRRGSWFFAQPQQLRIAPADRHKTLGAAPVVADGPEVVSADTYYVTGTPTLQDWHPYDAATAKGFVGTIYLIADAALAAPSFTYGGAGTIIGRVAQKTGKQVSALVRDVTLQEWCEVKQ